MVSYNAFNTSKGSLTPTNKEFNETPCYHTMHSTRRKDPSHQRIKNSMRLHGIIQCIQQGRNEGNHHSGHRFCNSKNRNTSYYVISLQITTINTKNIKQFNQKKLLRQYYILLHITSEITTFSLRITSISLRYYVLLRFTSFHYGNFH
jgi:hypothetical protein